MNIGIRLTRTIPWLLALALAFGAGESMAKTQPKRINNAVVKIFAVSNAPNFYVPWQYKPQQGGIGSGVILSGHRILTNAHLVANNVFIQVKKSGDPTKYQAKVAAVGHQCDLALLQVDDPSFFEGTESLELGDLPDPQDEVSVFGFPKGGNEISITKGIVSRIEQMMYAHGAFQLLGVQIDAAINPGNSGGPVLRDGQVVGIAMQSLRQGDNIGYIIPTPIINHFLKDVADGRFDGFPDDGIMIQAMENEALRGYHGMEKGETGVLVAQVVNGGSAYGHILPGDVITSIGGVKVSNDNTIKIKEDLRVSADYLVRQRFLGDQIEVGVIRERKRSVIKFPLKSEKQLVPLVYDRMPTYYVFGGLVFMPLTKNYLMEWGRVWNREAPPSLVTAAEEMIPTEERGELVFLSNTLAHPMNAGYQEIYYRLVEKVNGVKIKDMKTLAAILDKPAGKYTVIELERGMKIAIDNEKAGEAEKEILERSGAGRRSSEDLR
jgi:S1-C subfamily serine protease